MSGAGPGAGGRPVLVYGVYPPTPGPEAATTIAAVRDLVATGQPVVVMSPLPSGAHRHADVMGLKGTLRFSQAVAAVRPAQIVAFLDAGLLRPRRGGRKELGARRLLGLALRNATVHLDDLSGHLDPPYVTQMLGQAARITVRTDDDAAALVAAGIPRLRVEVHAGSRPAPGPTEAVATALAPWTFPSAPNRATIEAEIRRRAAADRAADFGGADVTVAAGEDPAPSGPLTRIFPYHAAAPVGSPRLLIRIIKQTVWRLTKFELEPIVDQVNLVHRATVEELRHRPSG